MGFATAEKAKFLEAECTPLVGPMPSASPSAVSRHKCRPLTAFITFLCSLATLLLGAGVLRSRLRRKSEGTVPLVSDQPPSSPWEKLAPMRSPRCYHAAVAIDGRRIVVMGGSSAPANLTLASVEMYDATKDEWSDLPRMSKGRKSFAAAVVENEIYVLGGVLAEGAPHRATASVEKLDLDRLDLGWQIVAPMREARVGCAASAVGRSIYVSGGGNHHQASYGPGKGNYTVLDPLASLERLDTRTGEWASAQPADMPCWRVGHGMFTMGSKLVVFGGLTEAGRNWAGVVYAETDTMASYDTSREGWFWPLARWKKGPRGYPPRSYFGAATDSTGGNVLVIAGGRQSGYGPIYVVGKYEKSRWSRLPDLGNHGPNSCTFGPGLYAPAAVIVDDRFVLTGGSTYQATSEVIALDYKKDWDSPYGRLPSDTCD